MHWLGWIRFFEAAARHESFVRAAQELHLTHGAVSRQIRQLEETLGVALFERRNRGVFLTEAGSTLFAAATQSMEVLAGAAARIRTQPPGRALVLSCEPTVAMRWLIPRLPRFATRHPDIPLHLMAAGGPIDFGRSGADLALRRNDFAFDTRWHAREVAQERVGPVCRPVAGPDAPLAVPVRLHTRTRPDAWQRWQAASSDAAAALMLDGDAWYEHFYLSLQAAAAGLGWAVASQLMAADEIADGRLAAPFGFVADGSTYHLLSPAPFEHDTRRLALLGWLREEAQATLGAPPPGLAKA
ncbi:LysR family transcriptional regulator [Cupriavidus necator]|uniref:LysR family transcriptional regulator n=1 Tax=Cupriavidus necator TaxID=106590 RepID=UPI0005B3F448|nr:LysR family transcriptional regulator [Cupriavidus necator]